MASKSARSRRAASGSGQSPAEQLAALSQAQRARALAGLSRSELLGLKYKWRFWARPKQLPPPGRWSVWLVLSGRGFGKTRTGAEQVRAWAEEARDAGTPIHIAIVGQTVPDVRDIMLNGESGLMTISDPAWMPTYIPSKRVIIWPDGTQAHTYSGDKPAQLRGPQHHKAWVDELVKFQYPELAWDNLEFGMRLGDDPQIVVTTTPSPMKLIRALINDSDVVVVKGSSYENLANLSPKYIKRVIKKYEGTRLGRQELHAEILDDVEGALWTHKLIDDTRRAPGDVPKMVSLCVSVDPPASSEEDSNEAGITVVGKGVDGHGYLFADASDILSPEGWGSRAVALYRTHRADYVVGEINNGGDMVEHVVHSIDRNVPFRRAWASRGKTRRAAPVAGLYEQGRFHHVGTFAKLEDQLCAMLVEKYVGGGSPDRADSMIWGGTYLLLQTEDPPDLPDSYSRRSLR